MDTIATNQAYAPPQVDLSNAYTPAAKNPPPTMEADVSGNHPPSNLVICNDLALNA